MEDIAASEPEITLEIQGRERAISENAGAEVRRELGHCVDHQIGNFVARIVPRKSCRDLRQLGMDVLAEEACDMLARWRERIIDDGRDQQLDNRRGGPATRLRIEISALHVRERRCDDDAAAMMRRGDSCQAAR